MTSTPPTIIDDEHPDTPDHVRTRLRGRHRVINKRGEDYRLQIIRLEDELKESQEAAQLLAVDLGRSRATATRLSEHTGLCFQLRRQVQERDTTIGELRQTLADQKAAADAAQTAHSRQLRGVLESAATADQLYKNLESRLTEVVASHGTLMRLYLKTQDERTELRTQLDRAERAVRHSLRDHARTSAQLIAVGAQLVNCQADLLAAGGAAPARPLTPAAVPLGATAVSADVPAALPAAPLSPIGDEDAADLGRSPAAEEGADDDLSLTLASRLCRNPGMDTSAFALAGEPISPADSPRSVSPGLDCCPGAGADRPRSVPSASSTDSGSTFGDPVFEPPSPRPLGATSPSGSPSCRSLADFARSPG